jgi:hypothetical protein
VYALQYKTSGDVLDFDKDGTKERSALIGGGIPSKTVIVITDTLVPAKMLMSVGSTNPDGESESFAAGVISIDPLSPDANFYYRWWRELTNLSVHRSPSSFVEAMIYGMAIHTKCL